MPPAYRADGIEAIKIDRTFQAGEKFTWEGYELTVDWMPGQTEFGCCIQGRIDGRLVAFTGDNLFADPDDPVQDGHEAVCARNSAILEEGNFLKRPQPYRLVVHCPEGLAVEPAVLEGTTPAEASVAVRLQIKAAAAAKPGVQIVALDTTIEGKRYGEWFDFVVAVRAGGAGRP